MGSIREYRKKGGGNTYYAEVRIQSHPPQRASFSSREEAQRWIDSTESALRGELLEEPHRERACAVRHDWTLEELRSLYRLPFSELICLAAHIHRRFHDPREIQVNRLISIKTGGCSEDCGYCAQSSHHATKLAATPLMAVEEVESIARSAKERGVTRICLGAAWRQVRSGSGQFERVLEMVRRVRALDLEVCCTLGMLDEASVVKLKEAGLYAYNHNLDTSSSYYPKVVTSHTYEDRQATLDRVEKAGLSLCCGGILGLGESLDDRLELIRTLATRSPHPDSVPINRLQAVKGTRLGDQPQVSALEWARIIAIARITMPRSVVRLTAGRLGLTDAEQALCFLAGANSIFVGEKLLTVGNPEQDRDFALLRELGMRPKIPTSSTPPKPPSGPRFLHERLSHSEERGERRLLTQRTEELVDFASNDYLGIASNIEWSNAIEEEYHRLTNEGGIRPRIGATGSRLLTGNGAYLEDLEQCIARYHGGESALLFSSGYSANTGLLSCLGSEEDAILLDAQVHASTWDGSRLSRAKAYLFHHNDLESLEKQLRRAREKHQQLFVCVESLYSMVGDCAPLDQIITLCERYEAWLIIDEAHATGLLGRKGAGLAAFSSREAPILARIHTFGKALGCHGAAIVGSSVLRDYLINRCRTFIYTTAFPLHTQVALRYIYERLPEMESQRSRLQELVRYLRLQVELASLPLELSSTPVQSIPIGDGPEALRISHHLREQGLDVRAIRTPTVRRGKELLRICLHSFNSEAEIDCLIEALGREQRVWLTA